MKICREESYLSPLSWPSYTKNLVFLKKVEFIFNTYLIVLKGFIFSDRKNIVFLRKKTTKGVDRPK